LKCHFKAVHSQKTLKCTFDGCNRYFSQTGILNAHLKTHSESREFVCDICDKRFKCKSYFKKHRESHAGNRPHACNLCGAKYLQASHLKDHMSSHTQERKFSCEFCSKKFRHKKQYIEHTNMHQGKRAYRCSKCSYSTPYKTNLVVHRKRHVPALFGGTKQDVDINIHSCQTCNLIYYTQEDLNRHCEKTHSGNKYHLCRLCEKLFLNKSSLTVHIRSYHADHDGVVYLKEVENEQQAIFSICSTCYVLFPSHELQSHLKLCQGIGQTQIKPVDLPSHDQDFLNQNNVEFMIEEDSNEGESPVLLLVNIPNVEAGELEIPTVSINQSDAVVLDRSDGGDDALSPTMEDAVHPLDLSMRERLQETTVGLDGQFLTFDSRSSENGGRRRSVFLSQEPDYEHQGDMTVVDPAEVTGGD